MSSKEYYEKIEKELNKIKNEYLRSPSIPISAYIQEAEDLYHIAKGDADKLVTVSINMEMIEDLNVRVGACRYAQSIWNKEQDERQEAAREWKEKSPTAFEQRDELVHSFFYAFRKNDELTEQVRGIAEGYSNADMIQDLSDLAVLGKGHQNLLSAINLDSCKLDKAAQTADEMGDLLAAANGDRYENDENKLNRDKAYTYLKEMVDEIRDAGKFIFWKDENKSRKYSSKFLKRRRSKPKTEVINEEDTL